jgi:hypothetical protein
MSTEYRDADFNQPPNPFRTHNGTTYRDCQPPEAEVLAAEFYPVTRAERPDGNYREARTLNNGAWYIYWEAYTPEPPVVDPHLAALRLAYATATRGLCGLLGIDQVSVLAAKQIKAAVAGVTSTEAILQLLAIVTELSNIELKLCMADGPDALERVA